VSTIIENYLDKVKVYLRLESLDEKEILAELNDHIQDEIEDLKGQGLRDDEAAHTCIGLLGSAKVLARDIYEAHSQGSWKQALMACLPHILFGGMFALNWWRGMGWMLVMLILVLSTTVWGWWHRKSSWLFPWLGYSLLPVIAAGLSLLYLPRSFAWLAVIVYIPLTIWLISRIMRRTIKSDWVYISLMLLPLPIIISWFLVAVLRTESSGLNFDRLAEYGPWVGLSFLALAISVISFVRVRRRWLKISALFLTGVITTTLIGAYAWGRIEFITLLLLILFQVGIFLIPALMENGVRTGKWGRIFEHKPTF
jgi:hypothetical protein